MTIKRTLPVALAALLAIGAVAGTAWAKSGDEGKQDSRDIAALATMKLTLPQAIAAAEQSAGGRALSADLSHEGGTDHIAVEIAGPQGVKTVLVDGQTGQVTASKDADAEDND